MSEKQEQELVSYQLKSKPLCNCFHRRVIPVTSRSVHDTVVDRSELYCIHSPSASVVLRGFDLSARSEMLLRPPSNTARSDMSKSTPHLRSHTTPSDNNKDESIPQIPVRSKSMKTIKLRGSSKPKRAKSFPLIGNQVEDNDDKTTGDIPVLMLSESPPPPPPTTTTTTTKKTKESLSYTQ